VVEALGVCGKSFLQLLDAIDLVFTFTWRPVSSNASALEDNFTELDYGLVVVFRRSFSFFRPLFLLFFACCILLLLRAATLLVLVVIVVVVVLALLVCPAPFPGWALCLQRARNILEVLARWSARWELGLACHNTLSTSLAYFN
jgi:hypothetical protein